MREMASGSIFVLFFSFFLFILAVPIPGFSADNRAGPSVESDIGSAIQGFQQGIRPFPTKKPGAPVIETPEEAEEGPTPSEKSFLVKHIKLVGATSIPASEFTPLLEKYENQKVSLRQLQAVAKKITQYYRQKGFVTSLAFLPPQKIDPKNPEVTVKVVEGKLGGTEVTGNRYFNSKWLLSYLHEKPGDVIDYGKFQQDVLALNRNPDREVKAILVPGKAPETTDILLKVDDKLPLHFAYSFDNTGTRLSGRLRQGMQFRDSNLLGRDDTLFDAVNISERGELVGEALQYLYPLSPGGDLLSLSFAYSLVELGEELRPLRIKGGANTYGIGYTHSFVNSATWNVDLNSGFDIKEIWSTVDGVDNSRDHLRVAHFGPNILVRDNWGTTSVNDNFLFGLSGFLGGSYKVDPRSNRPGAGGQFFIDELNASRAQRFFWDSVLLEKIQGQFTKYLVVSTQQFRAGGADTVRGYGEGDSLGDYGFLESTEWRVPPYFLPKDFKLPGQKQPLYDSVQFVGFADMANVYLRRPALTQEASRLLIGVGGGIRVELPNQVSARVDWGYPIGDKPVEGREFRIHFALTTQLPNLEDIGKALPFSSKPIKA